MQCQTDIYMNQINTINACPKEIIWCNTLALIAANVFFWFEAESVRVSVVEAIVVYEKRNDNLYMSLNVQIDVALWCRAVWFRFIGG